MQFHVLSSGSAGNASVLETDGFGVLIDFGLPLRALTQRMGRCALTWDRIHAALLTHTHSDHWQPAALTHLAKLQVPLYCHAEHAASLQRDARTAYRALDSSGLLRFYEPAQRWSLHPECHCLPIALQHDGTMTCGFRFEGEGTIFGAEWALGYAADLGCWTPELARLLADVDLLALEFNHDVAMQLKSGRQPFLIRRVLSDQGHLSNDQAAALLSDILQRSEPGRLRSLVQLHLSRECNRPELAHLSAQKVLARFDLDAIIHTTEQEQAGPTIRFGGTLAGSARRRRGPRQASAYVQPLLPYAAEEEENG